MKLIIPKDKIERSSAEQFLRRAGYGYLRSRRTGQESYSRHLGGGMYPRFHVYADDAPNSITINLHLDQKEASYEGTHAHSGEYDGELVGREISRLNNFAENLSAKEEKEVKKEKKIGWFKKLFGN
jgi:hypothetical protein